MESAEAMEETREHREVAIEIEASDRKGKHKADALSQGKRIAIVKRVSMERVRADQVHIQSKHTDCVRDEQNREHDEPRPADADDEVSAYEEEQRSKAKRHDDERNVILGIVHDAVRVLREKGDPFGEESTRDDGDEEKPKEQDIRHPGLTAGFVAESKTRIHHRLIVYSARACYQRQKNA